MSDKIYNVPAEWASRAWVDNEKYLAMYKRSVEDPNGFWGEVGKRIDWIRPYTKVKNTSYDPANVSIKWYEDGTLNISANCIDRHRATIRPSTTRSPTASCTSGSASSPTC
jgi:acetyl-CoA synthetase